MTSLPQNAGEHKPLPPEKNELEKEISEIPTVCAWCGKASGPPATKTTQSISHGICPACSRLFSCGLI